MSATTKRIGRPPTYNELVRNRIRQLRLEGNTWPAIAERLGMTFYQVIGIADRDGLHHLIPVNREAKPRIPQPIPRGVPTLDPLPSLQMPLYIIPKGAPDDSDSEQDDGLNRHDCPEPD